MQKGSAGSGPSSDSLEESWAQPRSEDLPTSAVSIYLMFYWKHKNSNSYACGKKKEPEKLTFSQSLLGRQQDNHFVSGDMMQRKTSFKVCGDPPPHSPADTQLASKEPS